MRNHTSCRLSNLNPSCNLWVCPIERQYTSHETKLWRRSMWWKKSGGHRWMDHGREAEMRDTNMVVVGGTYRAFKPTWAVTRESTHKIIGIDADFLHWISKFKEILWSTIWQIKSPTLILGLRRWNCMLIQAHNTIKQLSYDCSPTLVCFCSISYQSSPIIQSDLIWLFFLLFNHIILI